MESELIKKISSERDSYRDLLEIATIKLAIKEYGEKHFVGKIVSIGEYHYMVQENENSYFTKLVTQ